MYENIQKAMSAPQSSTLSYEDQAQNYALFSDLMKRGVKLQDLINEAKKPREPEIDETIFAVMETAVADNPEVRGLKQEQDQVMKHIILKICQTDPGYQEVSKKYRNAVNKAYIALKNGSPEPTTVGTRQVAQGDSAEEVSRVVSMSQPCCEKESDNSI